MISALSARETTAQDEGGSEKKEENGRKEGVGGGKLKQPRPRAKATK